MKKLSKKQRRNNVKRYRQNLSKSNKLQRRASRKLKSSTYYKSKRKVFNVKTSYIKKKEEWKETKEWINGFIQKGLIKVIFVKKFHVSIVLPEKMDFNKNYEVTTIYMQLIRRLTSNINKRNRAYKLTFVNFEKLKVISSSAALVLTAELSRWDDIIRKKLSPNVEKWDPSIVKKFRELGFFDLFGNKPEFNKEHLNTEVSFVKYKKGKYESTNNAQLAKVKELKGSLNDVIDNKVQGWNFLHTGLSEAITNVTHHAYPESFDLEDMHKKWYLTGAYHRKSKELKVAFYDQGVGIPKTLPVTKFGEKVLSYVSKHRQFEGMDKRLHSVLIKAAVELERTRTDDEDRGKGLQDLLVFIRQRKNGYLSILSLKGLYKNTIFNGNETVKSESFDNELPGTLIIWSIHLG